MEKIDAIYQNKVIRRLEMESHMQIFAPCFLIPGMIYRQCSITHQA